MQPEDKQAYKELTIYHQAIQTAKTNYFANSISGSANKTRKLFKVAKNLMCLKSTTPKPSPCQKLGLSSKIFLRNGSYDKGKP